MNSAHRIRGLFVTGTGTGVGKTLVTAGLLRALRNSGVAAGVMKPFQTGCTGKPGLRPEAPDAARVLRMAGMDPGLACDPDVCPYPYEPACSPHLAASMAGECPEIDRVLCAARRLSRRFGTLLIEGAGGILVPINPRQTLLDLAGALNLPVLVVARAGLGTINETLLTLRALRGAGLRVLGVVFSAVDPGEEPFIVQDNPRTVEKFGRVPVLAALPRLEDIATRDGRGWQVFDESFDPPVTEWELWRE